MTHTILDISHISKVYRMDGVTFTALSDVSLCLYKGDYVAIMGPSGSGKSTLMHSIGCLDRPSEGTIHIDGIDIATTDEKELAGIRNKNRFCVSAI